MYLSPRTQTIEQIAEYRRCSISLHAKGGLTDAELRTALRNLAEAERVLMAAAQRN